MLIVKGFVKQFLPGFKCCRNLYSGKASEDINHKVHRYWACTTCGTLAKFTQKF